ncbi:hypothetical protein OBA42_03875 [Paracoccaceae bacterium]|nr:hypothetical protein [Paracoccaceae bacterium]
MGFFAPSGIEEFDLIALELAVLEVSVGFFCSSKNFAIIALRSASVRGLTMLSCFVTSYLRPFRRRSNN